MRRSRRSLVFVIALFGLLTVLLAQSLEAKKRKKNSINRIVQVDVKDSTGKRQLRLRMPLRDMLPILESAYKSIKDITFRRKLFLNGFMRYRNTSLESELLQHLHDYALSSRDEKTLLFTLVGMTDINARSPITKDLLKKAQAHPWKGTRFQIARIHRVLRIVQSAGGVHTPMNFTPEEHKLLYETTFDNLVRKSLDLKASDPKAKP